MIGKKICASLMVGAMMVSMTACDSIKNTLAMTKVSAATPENVLKSAADNFESYDNIESMTSNMKFSLNLGDYSIKGTSIADVFVNDLSAHARSSINMNGEETRMEVFANEESIVYATSMDNGYKKIDLSMLSNLNLDPSSILSDIGNIFNNNSDSEIPTKGIDNNTSLKADIDIKAILEQFASMSKIFKMEGVKNVNGKEAYVVTANLNKENLSSLLDVAGISFLIPEGLEVPIEMYVSTSGMNFAGIKMDLGSLMSLASSGEKKENVVEMSVSVNEAKKFEIPEAEPLNLLNLLNIFKDTSGIKGLIENFVGGN